MVVEGQDLHVPETLHVAFEAARLDRLDRRVGLEQRVQLRVVHMLYNVDTDDASDEYA